MAALLSRKGVMLFNDGERYCCCVLLFEGAIVRVGMLMLMGVEEDSTRSSSLDRFGRRSSGGGEGGVVQSSLVFSTSSCGGL